MLDLFCGRLGVSKAFADKGWECVCIDLVEPPEVPRNCTFYKIDVLSISHIRGWMTGWDFDFLWASSPCEQFSVHGMKHFHPNPPYPDLGIKLFNHTRSLFESSGLPYVMENVRAAQQFVGNAVNHCGPYYLWGNAVPPLMPQGVTKGMALSLGYKGKFKDLTLQQKREARRNHPMLWAGSKSPERKEATALAATIPPELASCVVDYAERLIEPVVV